jgi:hypothetical protein
MLGLGRSRANREHRFTADNLSAYIDDELAAAERARVERHLAVCADCRRDAETLRQTVTLLHSVPLQPVPRSFALPASARATQARYRRWSTAFGALRAATVTVATMLVLVFAGDAALSSDMLALPVRQAAGEATTMLAPSEKQAPVEEVAPMMAEAAPAPKEQASSEAEGDIAPPHAQPESATTEQSTAPAETARALQPPRDEWPGTRGEPSLEAGRGLEPGAEGVGGAGGAGDMGGLSPSMPGINGLQGHSEAENATPKQEEAPSALAVEAEPVPSRAAPEEPADAGAHEPRAEMIAAPTPAAQPTPMPPGEPSVASGAEITLDVAPEASAQSSADGEPIAALAHRPELPWWQSQYTLRRIGGVLVGMLLISLAGTIWAGYKRSTP